MRRHDLAELFLRKADQDMVIVEKGVSDPEIADEIVGFHAQQAAEKILKAVLAHGRIEFPFTHRLADLLDLLNQHGIEVPEAFEDVRFLTPFAVELRYGLWEDDDEPFDLERMSALLKGLRKWAQGIVHS